MRLRVEKNASGQWVYPEVITSCFFGRPLDFIGAELTLADQSNKVILSTHITDPDF